MTVLGSLLVVNVVSARIAGKETNASRARDAPRVAITINVRSRE